MRVFSIALLHMQANQKRPQKIFRLSCQYTVKTLGMQHNLAFKQVVSFAAVN